jgi:hypothetical protein
MMPYFKSKRVDTLLNGPINAWLCLVGYIKYISEVIKPKIMFSGIRACLETYAVVEFCITAEYNAPEYRVIFSPHPTFHIYRERNCLVLFGEIQKDASLLHRCIVWIADKWCIHYNRELSLFSLQIPLETQLVVGYPAVNMWKFNWPAACFV